MASELETLTAIEKAGNLNPVQRTQLDNLRKTQGATTSGGTPRLDFVRGLTDQMVQSDVAEKAKVDTARTKLVDYYSGLEKPLDRYTRFSNETGLGDQQKLVDNLTKEVMTQQDLVDSIPASVIARSGDFLINDADKTAITAHEQKPVYDNLTKLLRSKQYEEVGLQGKQALVATLLDLSFKGDEMGAKPLQLGVDFTTEDRAIARELFTSMLTSQSSAFSADQNSIDEDRRAAEARAFQEAMFGKQTAAEEASQNRTFAQQEKMNNLDFAQQLALKASSRSGSGSGSSKIDQKTQDAWNKILASSKTEYDAWKKINQNQSTLRSQGVDVDKLWSLHAALAAKTGTGGQLRSSSSSSGDGL